MTHNNGTKMLSVEEKLHIPQCKQGIIICRDVTHITLEERYHHLKDVTHIALSQGYHHLQGHYTHLSVV